MFCKRLKLIIFAVTLMIVMGTCACAAQEYDVAAFYWPSCHFDERWATFFPDGSQGEWESIRNCKPKWEGHYQPRVPAWGYLMDNDPAAMEKRIEAATSHGVNVMLFDWYWFENKPFLKSALNDGFLKARNVDTMKFYLLKAKAYTSLTASRYCMPNRSSGSR
ncbi:MAG: glycoside hydrolase family 99-like domain-containing protein [Deltaproteobacteria bacterium]|nr:glycoside hydrolase family 99-like domain-containing protein [Deltaproteobacteria bacterium]